MMSNVTKWSVFRNPVTFCTMSFIRNNVITYYYYSVCVVNSDFTQCLACRSAKNFRLRNSDLIEIYSNARVARNQLCGIEVALPLTM